MWQITYIKLKIFNNKQKYNVNVIDEHNYGDRVEDITKLKNEFRDALKSEANV